MIVTPAHHPHKYMTKDGYAWGCCGQTHVFESRHARDVSLEKHNQSYRKPQ